MTSRLLPQTLKDEWALKPEWQDVKAGSAPSHVKSENKWNAVRNRPTQGYPRNYNRTRDYKCLRITVWSKDC